MMSTHNTSLHVSQLLKQAAQKYEAHEIREASRMLAEAKALRQNVSGIDTLRAKCFLALGSATAARQALYEELAHFPNDDEATQLLNAIPEPEESFTDDSEFLSVLSTIRPYTMVGVQRLFSLYSLAKNVVQNSVDGNFVECGVARGGSAALLGYVMKKYSNHQRRLFAFDSFNGMPDPTTEDTYAETPANETGWGAGTCAAPVESLLHVAAQLDLQSILVPVAGDFCDTLPAYKNTIGRIAFLHMDGDWYRSTMTVLENLYENVVDDGIIQVDDYGYWDGCRKAIHEFELKRHTTFVLNAIDGVGVWFCKKSC